MVFEVRWRSKALHDPWTMCIRTGTGGRAYVVKELALKVAAFMRSSDTWKAMEFAVFEAGTMIEDESGKPIKGV